MSDIVVCGVGALGSQIALNIASPEYTMRFIDFDRIGPENVNNGTTIFWRQHIGALKAVALAEMVYRRFGVQATVDPNRFNDQTVEHYSGFEGSTLVLDCFDNVASRACLTGLEAACLHVAVSGEGTGIIQWGDAFVNALTPGDAGPNNVCTHLLGRRLLAFTAAVAVQVALEFLETNIQRDLVVTRNLSILS